MNELQNSAYHESGKIVIAYHVGFTCSQSVVSATDFNRGSTSLQVGDDKPLVDIILQRAPYKEGAVDIDRLRTVGMKLINLFASGTCSRVYYSNGKNITPETEIDLPGGDYSQIELVKNFLSKHDPFFSDTLIEMAFSGIFQKLSMPEFSSPIESLAEAFTAAEGHKLLQSEIESILRNSGMPIQTAPPKPSFQVSVAEPSREEVKKHPELASFGDVAKNRRERVKSILLQVNPNLSVTLINHMFEELQSVFKQPE
jgi:hypothetical protein